MTQSTQRRARLDSGSAGGASADGRRSRRGEITGWILALVIALGATAYAVTVSEWLMFTDGDSVIVSMMVRSLALAQPQDWAMSPVLFLPEAAIYGVLSVLGLGMRATLALNGVVNLLLLYGAIRVVAGRAARGRSPVRGSILAFTAFALLVLFEGAEAQPGFQLAALLLTTTYYSATVLAAVVTLGLVRRMLDGAAPLAPTIALALVATVSMLTNPLFAVWAVLPALAVLVVFSVLRRAPARAVTWAAAAMVIGSAAGYLARGMFAETIVASTGNYFRADRWSASRDHFGTVLAETARTWHGMLWLVLVAGLTAFAVLTAVRAWREQRAGVLFVASVASVTPALVTLGAMAIGSDADRYLQPWVFLPVLALAVAPPRWFAAAPATQRRRRAAAGVIGILGLVIVTVSLPTVVAAATREDADLACVVEWVEASGRTGAGQFWAVRAPKAALDDPTQLVQVDHQLREYEWLVNRTDGDDAELTFLVEDASSTPWALPTGITTSDAREISCGRYTILDFGSRTLPLGPARN